MNPATMWWAVFGIKVLGNLFTLAFGFWLVVEGVRKPERSRSFERLTYLAIALSCTFLALAYATG